MKQAIDTDPYLLPADLPVPVDDGACRHLRATKVPSISLRSTSGRDVNLASASSGRMVFFFYPETRKPGTQIPKTWNEIPGARGCTPQSCSFRDRYRNNLPYELLNDSDFRLTNELRLPTFKFESKTFIKRLALVIRRGIIEKVFYPVFPPEKNAEVVLEYLRGK